MGPAGGQIGTTVAATCYVSPFGPVAFSFAPMSTPKTYICKRFTLWHCSIAIYHLTCPEGAKSIATLTTWIWSNHLQILSSNVLCVLSVEYINVRVPPRPLQSLVLLCNMSPPFGVNVFYIHYNILLFQIKTLDFKLFCLPWCLKSPPIFEHLVFVFLISSGCDRLSFLDTCLKCFRYLKHCLNYIWLTSTVSKSKVFRFFWAQRIVLWRLLF